jgi:predicted polyphosphate/ATP-dependent NAD kinase
MIGNDSCRVGLLINPLAGLGGTVGLAGSDGAETVAEAERRGAVARAQLRAAEALHLLVENAPSDLHVVAAGGDMGEHVARASGRSVTTVHGARQERSTGLDTKRAAREILARRVDLLLFAGGDGTARDLMDSLAEDLPIIGIPAGVKMHSGVFALSPRAAGRIAARHLSRGLPLQLREVMDLDEARYRVGGISAELYGYMLMPYEADLVQGVKASQVNTDERAAQSIAEEIVERMRPDTAYILGPGTTTRAIAQRLGLDKTLIGVDVVANGSIVIRAATERDLLRYAGARSTEIVLTPIGGQGHVLGRGNQQISPALLRLVGPERLTIVATPEKLASLRGRPLQVDSGDAELDLQLRGYWRVVTGYHREVSCLLSSS